MPRVPSEFVPQVPLQDGQMPAYQAPEVVPMRSFAGEQQAEMGNTMRNTGNVVWRIGQIIQDEINEASIKEADVKFAAAANDILKGENGYLTTANKEAETRFGDADSALRSAANTILDGLDNDAQRTTFRQIAGRSLLQYESQMADHRNKQVREFKRRESALRADMRADQAALVYDLHGETADYFEEVDAALDEARTVGTMDGLPTNSDQMKELERSTVIRSARGITRKLADRKDFQGALDYLDGLVRNSSSDNPQERRRGLREVDVEQIRSALMDRRSDQSSREFVESALTWGTQDTPSGTSNFLDPADSGERTVSDNGLMVTYKVSEGMPVRAPGNVVVESVDGDSIILTDNKGWTFRMNNVRPAAIDGRVPRVGDQIAKGKLVGIAVGKPTGPGSEGYSTFDYEASFGGEKRNPTTVNWTQPADGPVVPKKPVKLSQLIDMIDSSGMDIDTKRKAREYGKARFAEEAQYFGIKNAEVVGALKIKVAQENAANLQRPQPEKVFMTRSQLLDWIPEADRAFVTAEDIDSVMGDTETSIQARLLFAEGKMTRETLGQLRGAISNEDFRRYSEAVSNPKYANVSIPNNLLTEALYTAKLDHLVSPRKNSADEKRALFLRNELNRFIAQRQVAKGGEFEGEELQDLMDEFLQLMVAVPGGWFGGTTAVPYGGLLPEDEPSATSIGVPGGELSLPAMRQAVTWLNEAQFPVTTENIRAMTDGMMSLNDFGLTANERNKGYRPPSQLERLAVLDRMKSLNMKLTVENFKVAWKQILDWQKAMTADQ